ncbi:hypothetical protein AUEXF2481DRAFT_42854 [Aureobasidium subglaciale EXF-2481]|uniref:Uncharacterized protein n=1 Tax=Aureobasidium subglaciale (strain EXF-2481) TaxID=1043005 RepID=A0A074Y4X8_AURSE|nr:uncharacterized protein AUEXF2481DRAFT_42854 [Aureobasidium subglaciale EXF-2481]KAI5197678.1 hypothetical protein E4T38_07898 [Aureobasidium subglaciale]KAI5216547.1 hypothetical protein E4T40_07908 [Aureobasidium subglaciale]KAI5219798.1 hypothetical protein E4T41_07823 [Aureobasidium subglaciale]KAI5257722.1 hypothetical protein E4T46_07799 [Aureobasidium subglaciale]KEQ92765.1 hypothetical protein AUEXF2481DRAFT_42854 [Aureobasidium subglaciale EXF-2481]
MASLWRPLRLLPPLQSTLSQTLGLRACTPIQSRLLHSSPILAARKPSNAVVKPVNAPTNTRKKKKQALAAEYEELGIPFQTHSPSTAPSVSPTQRPTSKPEPPTPTTKTPVLSKTVQHKHVEQSTVEQPIVEQPIVEQPIVEHSIVEQQLELAPAPQSPLKPTYEYIPGGRSGVQASLRKLAAADSPILIYEATKARQYVGACVFASLFLGGMAAMQIGFFTTDPSQGDLRIASVFLLTAAIWGILSSWTAFGAVDVIKKIWAIPSISGRPLLRIEPVKTLFGQRPLPFDVHLGRVFSNKRFEENIGMFEATRPVRRKPGLLDALLEPLGTIMGANMKMIQRKSYFAQLNVKDVGTWKVDLRDCKALDGGKTLDLLVLPSETQRGWFASLFVKES